jgi:Cation transporter/ATPase, N-terminus
LASVTDGRTPLLLRTTEAAKLLVQYGRNELEEKVKPKWKLFVEQVRKGGHRGPALWLKRSPCGA